MTLQEFVVRWEKAAASERANKDSFLIELCDLLGLPRPAVATGDPEQDRYVFEADAVKRNAGKANSIGKMDLYKEGCFIFEAKQGSDEKSKKRGTARRNTPQWAQEMNAAYGQALGYAQTVDKPPVFLIACDIGHSFDLYSCFDGSRLWRPFPTPQTHRFFLNELGDHLDTLRTIWTDPKSLDPSLHAAQVTREVASHLAELAKALEKDGEKPEDIATFLMRCLFTMFAEDVGLLPDRLFHTALRDYWLPNPRSFLGGLRHLWKMMNDGGQFDAGHELLRFNGGLFKDQSVLPLKREQLKLLLDAASCDWSQVEPSIFGTLLERALDAKERHRLGAHYTPRAYVERLVRPTIEEPLRQEWDEVQLEVRALLRPDRAAKRKTAAQKEHEEQAQELVRAFHRKLCQTRVLDPACGTGNFLYVTFDLFKRLEGEILQQLQDLGDKQALLHMKSVSVTLEQFLGIEVKRWAKEIAELVLWIGYLQWTFKTRRKGDTPAEPVLRDYHNIECRDALLEWDSIEPVLGKNGKPLTRWDGESKKKSPVTGEDVPDTTKRVAVVRYVKPRKARWPATDFVIGNPPFVANRNLRGLLGDGYTDALREAYPEVREPANLVMWFWLRGALTVSGMASQRSGLITTSAIRMTQNQGVVKRALAAGAKLVFAIPDHPWPDDGSDAEVRISMTVLGSETHEAKSRIVLTPIHDKIARGRDRVTDFSETELRVLHVPAIPPDLSPDVDASALVDLTGNARLDSAGMKPYSRSLIMTDEAAKSLVPQKEARARIMPLYWNGQDVGQLSRDAHVVDLFGYDNERAVRDAFPKLYQHLLNTAKPERSEERNPRLKKQWWLFEANRENLRKAISGLGRFIVTVESSPVRAFVFAPGRILPDQKLRVIASPDAFVLGVLSSRAHLRFSLRAGGRQGVRNTPVYNTRCFTAFPFPAATDAQKAIIRDLGEQLDAHRKKQQAAHPKLTITDMYNVLEKLRSGETLTDYEKSLHEQGLVSVLKQLHDDLDAAVFDAYGWPADLPDEQVLEKLVALNAERVEEEKRGLIRWLRPEFQNPSGVRAASQVELGISEQEQPAPEITVALWPKKRAQQIRAVRDLVVRAGAWTAEQVAASFKGAPADEVESMLDDIEALGQLVSWEEAGVRHWGIAARVT